VDNRRVERQPVGGAFRRCLNAAAAPAAPLRNRQCCLDVLLFSAFVSNVLWSGGGGGGGGVAA
jgi:hypothetical protein